MEYKISANYILVTPAKNEEKKLPLLAKSIIEQTITPKLWVIVDDGSTDNTAKIIKELERNYEWIHSSNTHTKIVDLGKHFAEILNEGFDLAISICNNKNIEFNYLGKVDADLLLPVNCFEDLIKKAQENMKIGIIGPGVDIVNSDRVISYNGTSYSDITEDQIILGDNSLLEDPSDAIRLFRKECFSQIGGFSVTVAPDSVINAKAKILGWSTKRIKDLKVYHIGMTSDTNGLWKGTKHNGYESYYLGISPTIAILQTIRLFSTRHLFALAYLYGYFISVIKREEQIDDKGIKSYFGRDFSKEVVKKVSYILKQKA